MQEMFLTKHYKDITKHLKKWFGKGHYDVTNIMKTNSVYNLIIGEKSNGKSTAVQMVMILIYLLYNAESVLLRLYDEDFKQGRAGGMFNGVPKAFIEEVSKGKYNEVVYKHNHWYLSFYNEKEDKHYPCNNPFAHRVHIINCGSSFQYPKIKLILFDEFITNAMRTYPNEFEDFQTALSTLIRNQTDVQIFMCGNTINAHSVYFSEFGIKNVTSMRQGSIQLYQYGNQCQLAIEYCGNAKKVKVNNDIYFAFQNSASKMITTGAWQLSLYPHCPYSYTEDDIIFVYFIIFEEKIYQCEVVHLIGEKNEIIDFTYVHEKTTPLQKPNEDLIFSLEEDARSNWFKNFLKPFGSLHSNILKYWSLNKVFYQNNEVGDYVWAYIKICQGN